jgi:methylmalonyl-CoA/ethylmalonyl-CoA epimerase
MEVGPAHLDVLRTLLKIKISPLKKNSMEFAQIAWVVKDIKAAETYFRNVMGFDGFTKAEVFRAKEYEGTYYGEPSDAEWLVSIAYSGGSFTELIQPVSGQSIFQDYLDENPAGGVQHIAYKLPIADFDKAVTKLTNKGYSVITSVKHPAAKICFFDTQKEIGVATEIMGITEFGEGFVRELKIGVTNKDSNP